MGVVTLGGPGAKLPTEIIYEVPAKEEYGFRENVG